jgi:hypothetical protein
VFYIKGSSAVIIVGLLVLNACAPTQRMGMVADPATGLQYGSVIQKNIFVDSAQFENQKIKLRIRNTSGDLAFNLHSFRSAIENSYRSKGYGVTRSNEYGMLVDVNVTYSGQVSRNMSKEFGFLGAAGGGLAGASGRGGGVAVFGGVIAGATLGAIVGSYNTEDTYIIVAHVTLGVTDAKKGKKTTSITFGNSKSSKKEEDSGFKPFRQRISTGISVFAGGRNVPQRNIVDGVRRRISRIISDVI